MKTIPLTKGLVALVDDGAFDFLNQWKWCAYGKGYAARAVHVKICKNKYKNNLVLMHRVIAKTPKGMDTDHINGDRLDNRKCNLRHATRSQNMVNVRPPRCDNSSGFRGVTSRTAGVHIAQIQIGSGKNTYIGSFKTAEAAHKAYMARKKTLCPEFTPE